MTLVQDKEFSKLIARNRAEQGALKQRFLKRVEQFRLEAAGAAVEYDDAADRLYVTFGEPRQGMALFAGNSTVVIVDPDNLEPLALEVNHPKTMGAFWANLAKLAERRGTVFIPGLGELREAAEQIGRELSAAS